MPDDVVADHAEHFETNRLNWDERAPVHAASDTYDLAGYRATNIGPSSGRRSRTWCLTAVGDTGSPENSAIWCH